MALSSCYAVVYYKGDGLIVVSYSKQLSHFDLFVEEASNGGAYSSSSGISTKSLTDNESYSWFTETSKIKYLTEGHEELKPLLSGGWEDIFKGVGQVFHCGIDEVRLAVSKYYSKSGYIVAKVKNDRLRYTVKCGRNADCPWYLHTIPIDTAKSVFFIKEFNRNHTYGGAYKLKDPPVKKKLIKHLFKDQIQSNLLIKPNDMVAHVKSCYGVNIKYHHAYKGKEASQAKIYDDDVKSYTDLVWYVEATKATNPGSYIKFEYNKETKRFDRLLICFVACILPMLYCDATFLTGRFEGTMMAATGVNGNQVPSEDIEGWEWFMENLQHYVDSRPITFITDRHEGLKKTAYCYNISKYEYALNEMCIIGYGWVAKYIRNIDPKHWENAFFVGCRYGTHSSSIAESFNNWIHRNMDFPSAALVDELKIKIMRMSSEMRELGRTYLDSFNPIFKALLKSHIDIGRPWNVTESGNDIYEVHSPSSYVVDLMQMTCTFQRWKVFGFPCAHATAAITMKGAKILKPEVYEPEDKFLLGIPSPPPGRPPKRRIRSAYEKERRPMKCSNCKKIGNHNKATCRLLLLE
ncbi:uncharacterized protein LOC113352457 [Papaver somniferum]|uniref:uncharacterized protein LOC113352457 n=1 Tax=Papaver somniferum TaxID=3469 RepID=UPI000E7035D4|nr:uncharacterized protein LOC113352457 [Papaver somniferum]